MSWSKDTSQKSICSQSKEELEEVKQALQNVADAVASGLISDALITKLKELEERKRRLERQTKGFFPSTNEYSKYFGLNSGTIKYLRKDAMVMHPGPINRDVEIASEIADGPQSVILQQVTNGLAVRMAVLFLVAECVK